MARTTTTVRGRGGIDTRDFKAMTKALRKAAPQVSKDLRLGLREAGLVVAEEAKKIASEHSTSIPATIKVRTAGANVAVIAGGDTAPAALLFELGNVGGRKSATASRSGKFRHPVFGNRDNWVLQDMHPFLAPAAAATAPRVEQKVGAALDKAVSTIAFDR